MVITLVAPVFVHIFVFIFQCLYLRYEPRMMCNGDDIGHLTFRIYTFVVLFLNTCVCDINPHDIHNRWSHQFVQTLIFLFLNACVPNIYTPTPTLLKIRKLTLILDIYLPHIIIFRLLTKAFFLIFVLLF